MDGFIGEIRIFPWNWNPENWFLCNGQAVSIQQYTALYAVIGTAFGGNGTTNFNLPNLMGQAPMGAGAGPGLTPRMIGTPVNGTETVTLALAQMPAHSHSMIMQVASTGATGATPGPAANTSVVTHFFSGDASKDCKAFFPSTTAPNTTLAPAAIGLAGSSGPHENRQPYLPMNFCICWQGEWPQRP
jgi:microcystin-dependent protein